MGPHGTPWIPPMGPETRQDKEGVDRTAPALAPPPLRSHQPWPLVVPRSQAAELLTMERETVEVEDILQFRALGASRRALDPPGAKRLASPPSSLIWNLRAPLALPTTIRDVERLRYLTRGSRRIEAVDGPSP